MIPAKGPMTLTNFVGLPTKLKKMNPKEMITSAIAEI